MVDPGARFSAAERERASHEIAALRESAGKLSDALGLAGASRVVQKSDVEVGGVLSCAIRIIHTAKTFCLT